MIVGQARETARRWVVEEVSRIPGFSGAYTAGSTNWLPDDTEMPGPSDLDVVVAVTDQGLAGGRRKFVHDGVLFDVALLGVDALRSPEQVMGDSQVGPSFRTAQILLDPSGHLTSLLDAVRRDFSKRRWVQARCDGAGERVLRHLKSIDRQASFPDQVLACLFAAGVTTHMLLLAGLRNPTVRRRYEAVGELLGEYGRIGFHETLLGLLGAKHIRREQAEMHLAAVMEIFAAAERAADPSLPFAADISESARPATIEGSRELIKCGLHREAMFWIAVTQSRCQKVLTDSTTEAIPAGCADRYRELNHDLGIGCAEELRRRREEIERALPRVRAQAEALMKANEEIQES